MFFPRLFFQSFLEPRRYLAETKSVRKCFIHLLFRSSPIVFFFLYSESIQPSLSDDYNTKLWTFERLSFFTCFHSCPIIDVSHRSIFFCRHFFLLVHSLKDFFSSFIWNTFFSEVPLHVFFYIRMFFWAIHFQVFQFLRFFVD